MPPGEHRRCRPCLPEPRGSVTRLGHTGQTGRTDRSPLTVAGAATDLLPDPEVPPKRTVFPFNPLARDRRPIPSTRSRHQRPGPENDVDGVERWSALRRCCERRGPGGRACSPGARPVRRACEGSVPWLPASGPPVASRRHTLPSLHDGVHAPQATVPGRRARPCTAAHTQPAELYRLDPHGRSSRRRDATRPRFRRAPGRSLRRPPPRPAGRPGRRRRPRARRPDKAAASWSR